MADDPGNLRALKHGFPIALTACPDFQRQDAKRECVGCRARIDAYRRYRPTRERCEPRARDENSHRCARLLSVHGKGPIAPGTVPARNRPPVRNKSGCVVDRNRPGSPSIKRRSAISSTPARSSGGNPQIISAILGLAATATLRKAFSPPSGAINALWITRLLALVFDGSEEPRAHRQ